jgi:L-ascorbate metabolism protein UlaG (beta-lactamase superfamily)
MRDSRTGFRRILTMRLLVAVAASGLLAWSLSAQAPPAGQGQGRGGQGRGGGRGGAQPVNPTQTFETTDGPVRITPIWHASTMIEADGKIIYVDLAPPAPTANLRPADLMLITDVHGDHMNANMVTQFSKPGTVAIAPAAVVQTISAAKPLANGERTTWEKWTIEAVPAYNTVRMNPQGQPFHTKGRGNGYVMTYGGRRFYFSGDTENVPELRTLQNIDVAFLCMFPQFTMSPEEAADLALAFKPRLVIPYHYRHHNIAVFMGKVAGSGIEVRPLNWYPQTGPAGGAPAGRGGGRG